MQILIAEDYQELSEMAADIIIDEVEENPGCVLGLATGTTPEGLYDEIARRHEDEGIDFSRVATFNLDEYRGLEPDHEQSYRYFMNEHFFSKVNIRPENTHIPDGMNPNADAVSAMYEAMIELEGGIYLQLVGLGHNGHIGFNEPSDTFPAKTHLVDLTESTINMNARLFDSADDVPRQAYTMGIGTIMAARSVLMVVSGEDKADIVRDVCFGPVTPQVPASILQFHPDCTIIVDEAAFSKCEDYVAFDCLCDYEEDVLDEDDSFDDED